MSNFALMGNTFSKSERIKGEKMISNLFNHGRSIVVPPIRMVYWESDPAEFHQVAVSAPKRSFKKAVQRNRIKRMLRELYRLNKGIIYQGLDNKSYLFLFIYSGKTEEKMTDLQPKMERLLKKFLEQVNTPN